MNWLGVFVELIVHGEWLMRSLSVVIRATLSGLLVAVVSSNGGADTIVLSSGARIEGRVVSDGDASSSHVEVETEHGGRVQIDRARVVEVISMSAAQKKYERLAPDVADTAEDHWQIAKWCSKYKLDDEQQRHLMRVIELDPQHAPARRALGYSEIGGRWVKREEHLKKQGYVRYKGKWRLAQEVALREKRLGTETAKKEWFVKLSRWRSQLSGDKRHEALESIQSVRDPLAIEAIGRLLKIERDRRMRFIYVELLGQIEDNAALVVLVSFALSDRDEEVFYACLEELSEHDSPPLVRQFVGALKSPQNDQVNRAAIALSSLGDRSAIPPLIEALVTQHQTVLPGSDQMTNTFVRDGGGLQSGDSFSAGSSGPQVITRTATNQEVLKALVKLTGVSFSFEQQAWRNWYAVQQRRQQATAADTRRVN